VVLLEVTVVKIVPLEFCICTCKNAICAR